MCGEKLRKAIALVVVGLLPTASHEAVKGGKFSAFFLNIVVDSNFCHGNNSRFSFWRKIFRKQRDVFIVHDMGHQNQITKFAWAEKIENRSLVPKGRLWILVAQNFFFTKAEQTQNKGTYQRRSRMLEQASPTKWKNNMAAKK